METLGVITFIIGTIGVLLDAFRTSVGWGVACLLLWPIVPLFFVIIYWRDAKNPFFLQLIGLAMLVAFKGH